MAKATYPCHPAIITEVHQVWSSIVSASGFGQSFPYWVVTQAHLLWFPRPSMEQVRQLKEVVMSYANKCLAEAWRRKRLLLSEQIEKAWNLEGGSLPFRLVKDPQRPPVTDMTVQLPVRLAPQGSNPAGKAWSRILSPKGFQVGSDNLQVDRFLTRREAASLYPSFVSAEPEVWTHHFLTQWDRYWNQPEVDEDSFH